MKKKVYYKLNRYKVAKVEVESVEQEQAVKILNRETDRFAKSEDTYYEKCSSLDEMYEETGFEPADDTPSPEEQFFENERKKAIKQLVSNGRRTSRKRISVSERLPRRIYKILLKAKGRRKHRSFHAKDRDNV